MYKMLETESEKLENIEKDLESVIGQGEAISAIASTIRRSRSGLSEEGLLVLLSFLAQQVLERPSLLKRLHSIFLMMNEHLCALI